MFFFFFSIFTPTWGRFTSIGLKPPTRISFPPFLLRYSVNLSWTPPSYDGGAEVVGGPICGNLPAEQFTASILFGPLKGDQRFCGNPFFWCPKVKFLWSLKWCFFFVLVAVLCVFFFWFSCLLNKNPWMFFFSRWHLVEKSGCFELDEVGYLVTTGQLTWSTDATEVSRRLVGREGM